MWWSENAVGNFTCNYVPRLVPQLCRKNVAFWKTLIGIENQHWSSYTGRHCPEYRASW